MACCVIAAFIVAQFLATLRRWGVFWGLLKPDEYDSPDTALARLRTFVYSTRGRHMVRAVIAVEFMALTVWVYAFHREHLYELADVGVARLEGRQVMYAERCDADGRPVSRTRIVVDDIGS